MSYELQSSEIKDIAAALAKAQNEIRAARKDKNNPFFKSKYADLTEVWDACRDALSANGLAVTQTTAFEGERIVLVTTLMHISGQWVRGFYPLNPVKNDPQSTGSATTYARRYALSAMVGIVTEEDDDGNKASGKEESKKAPKQDVKPPTAAKPQETKPAAKTEFPTKDTAGNEACGTCGATMILSKNGTHFFCPDWQDGRKHRHPVPTKKGQAS